MTEPKSTPGGPESERRWRKQVLLIGLLAFVLHMTFAFGFARFFPELSDKQIGDQGYDIAVNLVDGKGYLHNWFGLDYLAWRPPVFPLLMAGLLEIFGKTWAPIRVMLSLCGGATAVATAYLGRRVFDARVGLIAAVVTAVNPSLVFSSAWPEPSNMIALLLVLGVLSMMRVRDGGLKEAAAAGGLMGLTVLAKTFYLTWPLFATAWLLLQKEALAARLRKAAVIWAVTLAVVSPWIGRNYMLFHSVRVATTDTSLVFWVANTRSWLEDPYETLKLPPVEFRERYQEFSQLPEIERDKWFMADAMKTVKEHRSAYVHKVFERAWLVWKPFPYLRKWTAAGVAKGAFMLLTFGPILGFFLASVYVLRREWRTFALSYMLILGLTGSLALVHASGRYRVPLEPLLIVQGAYVAALVADWWRLRRAAPGAAQTA